MFEVVREALLVANFFAMKSSRPGVLFENSRSWISVTCDGEFHHSVSVIHPASVPNGFREVFALATKVKERGKPAGKATSPLPPRGE